MKKQGMIRKFICGLFDRKRSKQPTATTTATAYMPKAKKPTSKQRKRMMRKAILDTQDMKHISGQARVGARSIRKIEYRIRRRAGKPLFPKPEHT